MAATISLIALATLALYIRVLPAFFVANDILFAHGFLTNPLPPADLVWQTLTNNTLRTNFYRPLHFILFGLQTQAWGAWMAPHHLTSIVLHAANGVLLFLLARRFVGRIEAAAAGALFFTLHPRRVEAVAWISGRADVLCTLFALVAILLYLRSAERRDVRLLIAAVGAWFGSLLGKEAAVLLPLAFLVVPVAPARDGATGTFRDRVRWLAPFCAALLAYLLMRQLALSGWTRGDYTADLYLRNLLLPFPLLPKYLTYSLVPSIDVARDVVLIQPWRSLVAAAMAVLAVTMGAIAWRHRANLGLRVAAACTAATIGPVVALGIRLTSTFNDRYLYLPGIGIALGIAVVLAGVRRRAAWALVALALAGYAAYTGTVVERWRTAGLMTERLAIELRDRVASNPSPAPAYLASLPDSYRGAYALREGIQELVVILGGRHVSRLVPLSLYQLDTPDALPVTVTLDRGVVTVRGVGGPEVIAPAHFATRLVEMTAAPAVDPAGNAEKDERRREVAFRLLAPGEVWFVTPTGITRLSD